MTPTEMTATTVCEELSPILSAELRDGNEVEEVAIRAFAKCDVLVVLKLGYRADHGNLAQQLGLDDRVNIDPHYPTGRSLSCVKHRHSLVAPT
jgi:hypothetical protein